MYIYTDTETVSWPFELISKYNANYGGALMPSCRKAKDLE